MGKADIDWTFRHDQSNDGLVNQAKRCVNYNRHWLQIDLRNYGCEISRVATMRATPNSRMSFRPSGLDKSRPPLTNIRTASIYRSMRSSTNVNIE